MNQVGVRGLAFIRAGIGVALIGRPVAVTAALTGGGPVPPPALTRVLGLRLLGQGVIEFIRPTPDTVATAVVVDAVHAASMLAAALLPVYRRVALFSAAEALAGAGLAHLMSRRH